ncbi:M1 family aminopeptidase [Flammeovirgaceae bacterium SG7u.111]|nr:M1 family aminopeptidase [Flammeovirgaceae bacterium SG7u.132]WPO33344.1 M1 family aminopeptidase [Flammeovirgaceae bacterium SG7u.111]
MKKLQLFTLLLFAVFQLFAQDRYPRHHEMDVTHYEFNLQLNDSTNSIAGQANISISFTGSVSTLALNLISLDTAGKGMKVQEVLLDGKKVEWEHENDWIRIQAPRPFMAGGKATVNIEYSGVPANGLVISENKFGDRTFFGDNWPDRGRHWLPCVDHLSDKATVDFIITAPAHYQVVGNGLLVEETNIGSKNKLYHWHQSIPIPTKVMVIGVAPFAIQKLGDVNGIPLESWVFPQNKKEGFYDYAQAEKILNFFHHHVGPYPYEKLANVQSKTMFGGMENASNIFYFENSVTGNREIESLLAHEIAHQWFGNSVSEINWAHIWLSEGFATYFTNLYLEFTYGKDKLDKQLETQRAKVLEFAKQRGTPVVDTLVSDYMVLLNANSYQKGGWVLHMLRRQIGDEAFWTGARTYYATYKNKNAHTKDLQKVMEEASGQDLETFFKQWLYTPGHPVLNCLWKYDAKNKVVQLKTEQTQPGSTIFVFPLEVKITAKNGESKVEKLEVKEGSQVFEIPMDDKTISIELDPNTNLLFEGSTEKRRF